MEAVFRQVGIDTSLSEVLNISVNTLVSWWAQYPPGDVSFEEGNPLRGFLTSAGEKMWHVSLGVDVRLVALVSKRAKNWLRAEREVLITVLARI